MKKRWKKIRPWLTFLLFLLLAGGAAAGVYRYRQNQTSVNLPVAPARQGDFSVIVRCRGELHARRSVAIYAPIVPALRIAWLAPSGEPIKEGDAIIKFDSSASQQQLMQKEAALGQAGELRLGSRSLVPVDLLDPADLPGDSEREWCVVRLYMTLGRGG